MIRTTAVGWLEEAGYAVLEAGSFAGARVILSDYADDVFDLIVMNIGTEDFSGVHFCAEVRRTGAVMPILIQTGYNEPRRTLGVLRNGASDILHKPYSKEQLVDRVATLLALPQLVSRSFAERTASNAQTVEDYCTRLIDRSLERLEIIRPLPGSMLVHDKSDGQEARPLPLDETISKELVEALTNIRQMLESSRPDVHEISSARTILVKCIEQLLQWLGGRFTIVTDEVLKNFVKVGGVVLLAHVLGLKVDLLHLNAALGVFSASGH